MTSGVWPLQGLAVMGWHCLWYLWERSLGGNGKRKFYCQSIGSLLHFFCPFFWGLLFKKFLINFGIRLQKKKSKKAQTLHCIKLNPTQRIKVAASKNLRITYKINLPFALESHPI
ncbi:MAG: hypothetical protein Ct9H300mP23_00470 [Nitrospinota bacterium]|nr:MAG: hypothetical protein Ct9H300mP23_00470 [Nitrospinota bacterium]